MSRSGIGEAIMKLSYPYETRKSRQFIAKGSAAEVQTQLYIALDQSIISQEAFDSTYQALDVVANQLSSFITYLKGTT